MKLILCRDCRDVVKGDYQERTCKCGACAIQYAEDGYIAFYRGPAIPLGFANSSLVRAISAQPNTGMGEEFTAFVIPKQCQTFLKTDT